jgi:uncharacterized repeat protein (TIGR01451 family)
MPTRDVQVRKNTRLFTELSATLLRRGHRVQFRAQGASMRPNLLDGDDIIVGPVSAADLRRGDIAMVGTPQGLRVHRVAHLASAGVITRGDAGLECDPQSEHILARAVAFSRNGREYPLNGWRNRVLHAIRSAVHKFRAAAICRLRRFAGLFVVLAAAVLSFASGASAQTTADLQLTQTASSAAIDSNGTTQSLGSASTATWTGGVASFTFPTPLPSGVFPNALLTTTGFTPSAYNITSTSITSVNYASGVVTVNLPAQTTGTATSATWAGGVASFTFPTPLPAMAVVGALLTTTGFTPAAYNVTNAVITSVTPATGVVTVALPAQSFGTATAATWAGGVTSFTFPTPLPSFAVAGAQLTTSGFTPSTYNVTNATIASANGGTGVITIAQATQALAGNASAASWAGGVLSFTFPLPLPSFAVQGSTLTTTNFIPAGYNVTNAPITSANPITGVITVALAANPGAVTQRRSGTVSPGPSSVRGTGSVNPVAGTGFSTGTLSPGNATVSGSGTVPTGFTYSEVVTNNSSSAIVTSGTITVYLQTPANTVYESAFGTNWSCTTPAVGGTGPIVCTYNATLASGATASTLTLGFQVVSGTTAGTTIQSSATVTNSTFVDTVPSNNTSLSSIVVEPTTSSDLGVNITVAPTPVFVASTLTYSIQVVNLGQASAPATANVLSDPLPTGTTGVTFASIVVPTGWSCTTPAVNSPGTVNCSITSPMPAAPAAGSTATIAITVNAPPTATTLNNTATVSLAGDPNSANNSATAYTVVQPIACATPGRDGAGGTITGIVNTYFPPANTGTLASASTQVQLGPAAAGGAQTPIAVGDLLLVIQMQGATLNNNNSSSYGDGLPGDPASGSTSLGSSGLFEFVTATTAVPAAGGLLKFAGTGPTGGLLNSYTQVAAAAVGTTYTPQQTYQVVRVPQYLSATLGAGLGPLTWNGSVGGVLVFDVSSQLALGSATLALDALGFRGGGGQQLAGPAIGGTNAPTDYVTTAPTTNTTTAGANASKGEGIAGTPRYVAPTSITTTSTPTDAYAAALRDSLPNGSYARGAPGNAGGGGTDGDPPANDFNSGGGGGANGGAGGQGGYGWNSMASTNTTDGGFGGAPFTASTSALVMGGGGGAGTTNNGTYCNYNSTNGTCTTSGTGNGIYSSGGMGGGIVIIHAGSVAGTGTITANGQNTLSVLQDSTGGGGGGGSILVFANSGGLAGLTVAANGGNAGEAWPTQAPAGFPGQRHGPGGGGGGGVIFLTATPANASAKGGSDGFTNTVQDSYGSTVGTSGVIATAHVITETPGTQSGAYCGSADLSVTNSGTPPIVAPGGTITYTQVVTNNGPLDAVNAVFSESIPANTTFTSLPAVAGWNCAPLPPVGGGGVISCTNPNLAKNATSTFTLTVTVNGGTASGTQIVDVANVVSGTTDPNLANNSATVITTVGAAGTADLQVTNSVPATSIAGNNVTYTAIVTNNGTATATGLTFTENTASNSPTNTVNATFVSLVPPVGWACSTPALGGTGDIVCTTASLGVGASATLPIVMNVPAAAPVGTALSASANIIAVTSDPNTGNNLATATTVVATAGQSDLAVSTSGTPNPVTQGFNISYTQSVTNNGPATASTATFTDTIPAGTTLVSFAPPANWTCNTIAAGGTGTFTCTLNAGQTIAAGAIVNFPMVVQVALTTAPGTTITNTVNINIPCSGGGNDPNCGNNTASSSVVVASPSQADVSIVKTAAPEPVTQGTNLTYTLMVSNAGPAIAQNVSISDNIPSTTTYVSNSTPQGSCSTATISVSSPYPSTLQVNCNLGSIGVGQKIVVTINVTAATFSASALTTNTATVTSSTSDPNAANNTSSAISTIQATTAVGLSSFNAFRQPDGSVLLEWHTHEESRNLGFHVYREDSVGRHRVSNSLIAGSALLLRSSKPQHAAKTYRWLDTQPVADAVYWIEDLDINGTKTLHGPANMQTVAFAPSSNAEFAVTAEVAPLSNQRTAQARTSTRLPALRPDLRVFLPRPTIPIPAPNTPRFTVADHRAIKIGVNQEGWYSISLAQLQAVGLSPYTDPRSLRLFAEGIEQPMLLTGNMFGRNPTGAIEFYGTGIDTPFSGTRIYWLVSEPGSPKRIQTVPALNAGSPAPSSFPFTVMREDRVIYFAALLNGEDNDNFFGPVVSSDPVDQDLVVAHFDASSAQPLTLDVALQGVTDAQQHRVAVQLNGSTLGEVDFFGMVPAVQTFTVEPSLLVRGTNTVTLAALEGDNDVSVVKSVALHYPHTYSADADWLRAFVPPGAAVEIAGFSNPQIRAFDITDPLNIVELSGKVSAGNGSYQIALNLHGSGQQQRTILAFAADAVSSPVSLVPHTATFLDDRRTGADVVMITHPRFKQSLAPLVRLRESQGYRVQLVTTDDIFDEYNFGERSPFAIRDYLKEAASHWLRKPQSVLLVGDASFDPRDYLGFGTSDFVPTRVIETAAFKTASDDWFTDFEQTGYATVPTGRLPVQTAGDADLVVSKIVNYEQRSSAGAWNAQALFIADQNTDNNFSNAATAASSNLPPGVAPSYLFADGVDASTARNQILSALNRGALLVNFDGHGAEQQWSFADLFNTNDAQALSNGGRLPVYIVMNCLNGFFQDVYAQSLAESILLAPNGGGVAVWASSGFTEQPPQATLNQAILRQFMLHPANPLGRLILDAKSTTIDNDVRRTWVLFGDPAMKLQINTLHAPSAIQQKQVVPPHVPIRSLCPGNMVCRQEKSRQ